MLCLCVLFKFTKMWRYLQPLKQMHYFSIRHTCLVSNLLLYVFPLFLALCEQLLNVRYCMNIINIMKKIPNKGFGLRYVEKNLKT